jgi:hypothetical protein
MLLLPLCVLAFAVLATLAGGVVPDPVLEQWRILPQGVSAPLRSDEEIDALKGRFISPILKGGFGNILFELAAAHAVAKQVGVPCLVAWWDQSKAKHFYRPYHGRGDPAPGITLKHIFPNLLYADFMPTFRNTTAHAHIWIPKKNEPLSEDLFSLKKNFMLGFYFHPMCMSILILASIVGSWVSFRLRARARVSVEPCLSVSSHSCRVRAAQVPESTTSHRLRGCFCSLPTRQC